MTIGKVIKTTCKQLLLPAFFLAHVLTPLIIVLLLLLLVSWLFPPGVNKVFATRTVRYLTPAALLACFLFLVLLKKNEFHWRGNNQEDTIELRDLVLLLFPLTPVLQYILNNSSLLSWQDSLIVLLLLTLLLSVPILILPFLFRKIAAPRSVMAVGTAWAFVIVNMASLSRQFAWHRSGSLKTRI